jgi:hypothetical protein
MLDLIRRYAALYLVEISGCCLMGNHFLVAGISRAQIYRRAGVAGQKNGHSNQIRN